MLMMIRVRTNESQNHVTATVCSEEFFLRTRYKQGGVINGWLNCFFFSMYRPSCIIEAYVRSEKYWLVRVGLLANHLSSSDFIFLSSGSRMSDSFCWYILQLASPIVQQWTDIEWSNWCEVSPDLSPSKHARQRNPLNSSPGNNMLANLPEFRMPPTIAGWSWRHEPALNPPKKGVFFARVYPPKLGDQMLFQQHLVGFRVRTFVDGNWLLRWKSARSAPGSTKIASFRPFSMESEPTPPFNSFFTFL